MSFIRKVLRPINSIFRDIFINGLAAMPIMPRPFRYLLYRLYGIDVHTTKLKGACFFENSKVRIGRGTFINHGCIFANSNSVEIGENCSLAYEVMLCTATHEVGTHYKRAGKAISSPIKIGNGCWIGARATIMPGVTIGDGCVVATGALVTKDCEPDGLYMGVPAKRIKTLN